MKKIITLLLVLLTLCACSKKNEESDEVNAVNPHGYEIVALEAGQLPLNLTD